MILIKLTIISFALLYSTVTFAGNFEVSNHQNTPDEFIGPLEEKDQQQLINRKISSVTPAQDTQDEEFVGPPHLKSRLIHSE